MAGALSIDLHLTNHIAELSGEIVLEMTDAVNSAGEDAADIARSLAHVKTGELQRSIHYDRDSDTGGTLYADSSHAGYVEFGTSHMAAEPFFTPALAALPQKLIERARIKVRQ